MPVRIRTGLLAGFSVAAGLSFAAAAPRPSDIDGQTAAAIAKTLPLMQASAQTWIERRPCASCHHQGLGSMTAVLARERGFPIDDDLLAAQVARMHAGGREISLASDALINPQISVAYILVALAASGAPADAITDARVHQIAGRQQPDGRWRSESHRPPLEDSQFTATAVAVRAIQLYAPPGRAAEIRSRVERARDWLMHATPLTTEDRAMLLFGLLWSGGPEATITRAAKALEAEQRPDGGWAQIPSLNSDAYATGQALVALNQAGRLSSSSAQYARGVAFLMRARLPDGSWHVATRRKFDGLPYFESGFPHGQDQFISYAATAWSTMALILRVKPGPSPVLLDANPVRRTTASLTLDDGVTPLVEAAASGTLADVRRLLDGGADVNQASRLGVTPLMAAVRDPAIAALLVEHGADVNARTKRGDTPLLLASGYDGGREVVRRLLDHQASEAPAADGMTALMRAARSGDLQKALLLIQHGADVNASSREGFTPLMLAADCGDTSMVEMLVQHGAGLDHRSAPIYGWTPLAFAAADGFADVARTLIAAGADVNVKDDRGRSVLDLARLMDNGPGTQQLIATLLTAHASQ